jgi:hypothetical protein
MYLIPFTRLATTEIAILVQQFVMQLNLFVYCLVNCRSKIRLCTFDSGSKMSKIGKTSLLLKEQASDLSLFSTFMFNFLFQHPLLWLQRGLREVGCLNNDIQAILPPEIGDNFMTQNNPNQSGQQTQQPNQKPGQGGQQGGGQQKPGQQQQQPGQKPGQGGQQGGQQR